MAKGRSPAETIQGDTVREVSEAREILNEVRAPNQEIVRLAERFWTFKRLPALVQTRSTGLVKRTL